ncbi:unnamed protein product [Ranitomeya imitator]|uniref:MHD domain-containing protein n=1 Tax=Ranitomeya imitator TaxID=111125 RepID=A0ABN9M6V2_9NEOB|nr:unnamed protein product [Ranitomeya imitator]
MRAMAPKNIYRTVAKVFSEYFKELEEESIRDNFVIIYELLDELMDFGYPQTTDSKILQEYITQEGHKLETGAPRPPATVTNAVSWRSEGIKYRKNEVFLDVIESVNLLGKHRVTKRRAALSNPMFTLVTIVKVKKKTLHTYIPVTFPQRQLPCVPQCQRRPAVKQSTAVTSPLCFPASAYTVQES